MICIVSHDAGGAEILASYVAQQGLKCLLVLAGPAVKVFERRLGPVKLSMLEEAVADCDWLLCGTGWQSDLEWQAIKLGRRSGKRTVAFLERWGNYRERFIRNGEEHLPDEIWVGDAMAEAHARACFPATSIKLQPNPYVEDLKRELGAIRKSRVTSPDEGRSVLFVCENIGEHALREYGDERHLGYTEHDAIRYFLSNLRALGGPIRRVVIRPHPSDPPGKYNWVSEAFGNLIVPSAGKSLLEEIVECDIVAGCESMAMVVGLLAGCRVISCVPPGGKACELPQPEIEHLHRILESRQ